MGGKWVCDSHYCSIHNHGFEEVWTGEKSEPHCPRCYHEQQEQEKKLAKEQRQKKEEQKRLEYEKAMSEAAEQKRKMDAVKIESILGVHFGDKYRWIRDKPISTQDGGGKVTISFEKPFRCFTTAEIFATPMERAYMLLARREFDVVSRSNLEREQMAIVEMLEKKFGMVFPRKSNDIIIFENDNVKVEVGIFTFNDKDGGVIAFCITNKAIRKEDNKAFLEKGFKSADKEDGADLL